VIFNPRLPTNADRESLLATTPEDFALSDKIAWKFAIRRGRVHRVGDYAQVRAIFARR
jgi:hypothetical protein